MGEVKVSTKWKGNLEFSTDVRGHQFTQDTLDSNHGPTPKEYTLAGVCGCTGMDVASLMKTMRQPLDQLTVTGSTHTTDGPPPSVFSDIHLVFNAQGTNIAPDKLLKAIDLSQTKYCGVSAMIARSGSRITYEVHLNGQEVGRGEAKFAPAPSH